MSLARPIRRSMWRNRQGAGTIRLSVRIDTFMVSRRQFLQGEFKSRGLPQRPPWARVEDAFIDACSRCGKCVAECPTKILVLVRGFPEVDFKRGECTFCGACTSACKDGALVRGEAQKEPWPIKAQIANSCLAWHGVECRVCADPCHPGAIRFSPNLGGPPLPEVDANSCTGCGACVAPCPVAAISLT